MVWIGESVGATVGVAVGCGDVSGDVPGLGLLSGDAVSLGDGVPTALGLGAGDASATLLRDAPTRSFVASESIRFGAAKATLAGATARETAMSRENAAV